MIEKKKKLVSRRDFLVAGGAVIAAGALRACTPKTTTETVVSTVTNTKTVTNTTTQTAPAVTTTVTSATNQADTFKVVWPLGKWTGTMYPLAKRLDNLAGKTVVFLGGAFRMKEVSEVLTPLLTAKYAGIKILALGSVAATATALKAANVQAAIVGVGG